MIWVMEDAFVRMLTSRLDSIDRAISEEKRSSAESRKRVYEKLESQDRQFEVVLRRISELERVTTAMSPTIKEFVTLQAQVAAAGKIGSVLWDFGKYVMAGAAGVAAAWAWLSGYLSSLFSGR